MVDLKVVGGDKSMEVMTIFVRQPLKILYTNLTIQSESFYINILAPLRSMHRGSIVIVIDESSRIMTPLNQKSDLLMIKSIVCVFVRLFALIGQDPLDRSD